MIFPVIIGTGIGELRKILFPKDSEELGTIDLALLFSEIQEISSLLSEYFKNRDVKTLDLLDSHILLISNLLDEILDMIKWTKSRHRITRLLNGNEDIRITNIRSIRNGIRKIPGIIVKLSYKSKIPAYQESLMKVRGAYEEIRMESLLKDILIFLRKYVEIRSGRGSRDIGNSTGKSIDDILGK